MAQPLLSSTAGLLLGALLVGGAALGLAPEPSVSSAAEAPAAAAIAIPQRAEPVAPVAPEPAVPHVPAPVLPAPTPAPVAAPVAPPPPPQLSAATYRSAGRLYAAVSAETGATLEAPLAGRVEVRYYQLVSGQIRTGANIAGLAYFPYVIVRSIDRVLTLRPGALGVDSEILVKDGSTVTAGTPLVRVTGDGASSWQTFYDRGLDAHVVVSLTSAGGTDLDAVSLFTRH